MVNISSYTTQLQRIVTWFSGLHVRLLARLSSRPKYFWFGIVAAGFAAEICIFFVYHIFAVLPDALQQDAFYHNRHVSIDLSSGEIVGGAHSQSSGALPVTGNRKNARALNSAPYEAITEFTADGPLPRMSGSLMPWQYYAKSYAPATDYPRVAIIVSDLGTQSGDIDAALRLPTQVTFSLSPYVSHAQETADRLRGMGFETMVDIPLQADDYPYSDPGPYAMLIGNSEKANADALHGALARFAGYTGGVASGHEILSGSESEMFLLVKEFTHRGIVFVYAPNAYNALFAALPFSNAWMAMPADILIDETPDEAHIKASLQKLLEMAKKQYFTIGILRPYPSSLETLQEWLPELEKQHIELVPLSVIARRKYREFEIHEDEAAPAAEKKPPAEEAAPKETPPPAADKPAEAEKPADEEKHE